MVYNVKIEDKNMTYIPWGTKVFVSTFPHFIAVLTTNDANRDVINFGSITMENGEILHYDINVPEKIISYSSVSYPW